MTLRRVVALAQALTMILLLLPGLTSVSPASVHAASVPVEPEPAPVLNAAGKGVGCVVGQSRYKGPGLPKDPPWPPGAEPTPSPEPSLSPAPSPDSSADPAVDSAAAEEGDDDSAATAPTMLLAGSGVRTAQAEPAAEATPLAEAPDARVVPDVTSPPKPAGKLIPGIDVSHWNGDIDYGAVKDAGHRFVFIKATQDNDFVDPMFPRNMAKARAAGLAAGAYHFFDYTLDGTAQADHFLDRVEAADGIDGALPPVVDVECWRPIGSSIHAVSATRLRDFVERVYERTGRMPIIYTSVHMWREVVGNAEGFEDLPLWAACWGCDAPPSLAPGWQDWAFWQIGLARIPGVGRLDGNYFGGTQRQLRSLKMRPLAIDDGAVATTGGEVSLDLGGRDATHLRTSPDGEDWTPWTRVRRAPAANVPTDEGEYELHVQLRNGPGLRSPVFRDSILVDQTPPEASAPVVSLRPGLMGTDETSVPVSVTWEARDVHAGLADAVIAMACDTAPTTRTEAPGSAEPDELASWQGSATVPTDEACTATAIVSDGAGNRARTAADAVVVSVVPGASVSLTGHQAGVIAERGPDAGRAAVLVDGEAVGLVDLYAPEPSGPEIVHVVDLDGGTHEIVIEATGTSDPASSGTAARVDGVAVLERG